MGASGTFQVKFRQKGATGATLRGPLTWSDCPVGFQFEAGGDGDKFLDLIIYDNEYYYCTTTHTKTSGNFPSSGYDQNDNLFRLGDQMGFVAAYILMTQYAVVENLGVRAIEMKDEDGNVVFYAKDGVITCTTGNFENINVKNAVFENMTLKGSRKIEYKKRESDGSIFGFDPRYNSRLRVDSLQESIYVGSLLTQGEYEAADAEGHDIEIVISASLGTRSAVRTEIFFEDDIVNVTEEVMAGADMPIYHTIATVNGANSTGALSITAGGYIRLNFHNGCWEVINKSGNIILE